MRLRAAERGEFLLGLRQKAGVTASAEREDGMERRIPMRLWYRESAPCDQDFIARWDETNDPGNGWEKWSLPVGCGWMGVNVFGRTETERLQITENSLVSYGHWGETGGGLNNFCELLLDFGHRDVRDYERELDLDDGIARTSYVHGGARHLREVFASYPDRILAVRHTSDVPGTVSFTMRPVIPFRKESADGNSKFGEVSVSGDVVTIRGGMEYYGVAFEGQFCLLHEGGVLTAREDGLRLEGADSAVILAAVGTNYRLESRVFTEPDPRKKLAPFPHPHGYVTSILRAARETGYGELMRRHLEDFREKMGRVAFEIDPAGMELPTDELLARYAAGERLGYLEMVYYQYGRYLLLSSSRPGTLPANLQGVWNCYDSPPSSRTFPRPSKPTRIWCGRTFRRPGASPTTISGDSIRSGTRAPGKTAGRWAPPSGPTSWCRICGKTPRPAAWRSATAAPAWSGSPPSSSGSGTPSPATGSSSGG